MKHKEVKPFFQTNIGDLALDRLRAEDAERDQLRKLVNDELKRYGLLLQRQVVTHHDKWRTKANAHVLYGQQEGLLNKKPKGFVTRPILCQGGFKECCIVAARILDELDAAQVPDTATGL